VTAIVLLANSALAATAKEKSTAPLIVTARSARRLGLRDARSDAPA
jgi:hypothetical protein